MRPSTQAAAEPNSHERMLCIRTAAFALRWFDTSGTCSSCVRTMRHRCLLETFRHRRTMPEEQRGRSPPKEPTSRSPSFDSGKPMFTELAGPEWTFLQLRTGIGACSYAAGAAEILQQQRRQEDIRVNWSSRGFALGIPSSKTPFALAAIPNRHSRSNH